MAFYEKERAPKGKYSLIVFQVQGYRSLDDVTLSILDSKPVVICGENNIGKTNFLRAMNVFFNDPDGTEIYEQSEDIPTHIYYGSRGSGAKTTLIAKFKHNPTGKEYTIKKLFKSNSLEEVKVNNKAVEASEANAFLSYFKFIFLEASNVDTPAAIAEILENDALLPLDRKRASNKTRPMDKLESFLDEASNAIKGIEKDLNKIFAEFTSFSKALEGRKLKIRFAEFSKLRDAIRDMTSITIDDGSESGMEAKGSGAQRAVLITLMRYVAKITRKNIIWALDEPEAFLQPKLQKKLCLELIEQAKEPHQHILQTTHSPYFIQLGDLSNTHLFEMEIEPKTYVRRSGKRFYKKTTGPKTFDSQASKLNAIKEHLGVEANDGWMLQPFNIIVEGYDDSIILGGFFQSMGLPAPNVLFADGAAKVTGYLNFFDSGSKDLGFSPKVVCVLDDDNEGRAAKLSIDSKAAKGRYRNIDVQTCLVPNYREESGKGEWSIEDFVPTEVFAQSVNSYAKSKGYKAVRKAQVEKRNNAAYKGMSNLQFFEKLLIERNEDKHPLELSRLSAKLSLAEGVTRVVKSPDHKSLLREVQVTFLNNLTGIAH